MLNPETRTLLSEALRPSAGFEITAAVATTYSLDLTAMLLAPLAFARLDGVERAVVPGAGRAESVDPLALLKAIRAHADRLTVFCQSGGISVPNQYQKLYPWLEQSIFPSVAPRGGSFHPKLWVLRMESVDGEIVYRVIVLSRNLTFDLCWDTVLVLDGVLRPDRVRGLSRNQPLSAFVAALPSTDRSPEHSV